jgi:pseudouridine-5'-phosphate glycosidase
LTIDDLRFAVANVRTHPEVEDALKRGGAVVALESAVITSGLPRQPLPHTSKFRAAVRAPGQSPALTDWNWQSPVNLELARAMERTVRSAGAIPATIAIIEGELCIGLHDDELVMLATEQSGGKASVADMAPLMSRGATAGTTVSATLQACILAQSRISDPKSRIDCFATGGIGGVHHHWQRLPDISADMRQIASIPVCVVCSGAKSILDLPATLEALETLGVPAIGHRTDDFPQFFSRGDGKLKLLHRVDDAASAARICAAHWRSLQSRTGILLCNPPPQDFALVPGEIESILGAAEQAAVDRRITGPARTPILLAEVARLTGGRSLDANIALLVSNARLAAEVAVELTVVDQ